MTRSSLIQRGARRLLRTLALSLCCLLGSLLGDVMVVVAGVPSASLKGSISHAAGALEKLDSLRHAGFILTDLDANVIHAKREHEALVPASTTKLLTAWLALRHWGEDHRFGTRLCLDARSGTLWIRGSGDPFLISEELVVMAQQVKALVEQTGIAEIKRIGLDTALFEPDLVVPGASTTNNPYDAVPTAIAANFNTLNLKRVNGNIASAEPQTPLTPFSRSFSNDIAGQSLRINTGRQSRHSEQYFAELLAELLRNYGVKVGTEIVWGHYPGGGNEIVYRNSHTLGYIVQAMLKYSTNFIANQVMLTLAAEELQVAANFDHVRAYMEREVSSHFQWKNTAFREGAGLSTHNRVSARQLVALLQALEPWHHLLPEVEPGIFAKTGTLTGVSTLAGLVRQPGKPLRYFALLINEQVHAQFSREAALALAELPPAK